MPVNESNTIQYTVTTSRVPDGTTLYWKTTGNTTNSDIVGGNTGSIVINNNQAIFNVAIASDSNTDGTKNLGDPSFRWNVVYAATGTINTSDDREKTFLNIGIDDYFGIPLTVWICVFLFLSMGFLMPRTRLGRYVYAIGSNSRAARLAGIRVSRWMLLFYVISGATAALAGFITVSRTGTGEPNANIGAELDIITAVILGGTVLTGGRGKLIGTFLALAVLAILSNGLILVGVPSYWQLPVKGCVLMGAIIWGEVRRTSRDTL